MPYSSSLESPMVSPAGAIAAADRHARAAPGCCRARGRRSRTRSRRSCRLGAALPKPSCTPSCSAMSPEISTIAASISTCGRRWSSWAISWPRSACTSARARTTTALISSAGWMVISSAANERPPAAGRLSCAAPSRLRGARGRCRSRRRSPAPAPTPRLVERLGDRAGRRGACAPTTPRSTSTIEVGVGEAQPVDPGDRDQRRPLPAGLVEVLDQAPHSRRPSRALPRTRSTLLRASIATCGDEAALGPEYDLDDRRGDLGRVGVAHRRWWRPGCRRPRRGCGRSPRSGRRSRRCR